MIIILVIRLLRCKVLLRLNYEPVSYRSRSQIASGIPRPQYLSAERKYNTIKTM